LLGGSAVSRACCSLRHFLRLSLHPKQGRAGGHGEGHPAAPCLRLGVAPPVAPCCMGRGRCRGASRGVGGAAAPIPGRRPRMPMRRAPRGPHAPPTQLPSAACVRRHARVVVQAVAIVSELVRCLVKHLYKPARAPGGAVAAGLHARQPVCPAALVPAGLCARPPSCCRMRHAQRSRHAMLACWPCCLLRGVGARGSRASRPRRGGGGGSPAMRTQPCPPRPAPPRPAPPAPAWLPAGRSPLTSLGCT